MFLILVKKMERGIICHIFMFYFSLDRVSYYQRSSLLLSLLCLKSSISSSNISSVSFSGPLRQIHINLSRFVSLNEECKGVQIRFITEKPRSTFEVEGGMSRLTLNKLAKLGKFFKVPSAAKNL